MSKRTDITTRVTATVETELTDEQILHVMRNLMHLLEDKVSQESLQWYGRFAVDVGPLFERLF